MNRLITICIVVLLASACGSGKDAADTDSQTASKSGGAPASVVGGRATAGNAADDVSQWFESEPLSGADDSDASALADPDAVIDRYKRECAGEKKSPECRAMRRDVEAIFLRALVAVRATTEIVDPRWYRLAADSETPQLACVGTVELIWDPKRTARDEALISQHWTAPIAGCAVPSCSTRKVPALAEMMKRSGGFDYRELTGVCVGRRARSGARLEVGGELSQCAVPCIR